MRCLISVVLIFLIASCSSEYDIQRQVKVFTIDDEKYVFHKNGMFSYRPYSVLGSWKKTKGLYILNSYERYDSLYVRSCEKSNDLTLGTRRIEVNYYSKATGTPIPFIGKALVISKDSTLLDTLGFNCSGQIQMDSLTSKESSGIVLVSFSIVDPYESSKSRVIWFENECCTSLKMTVSGGRSLSWDYLIDFDNKAFKKKGDTLIPFYDK